MIPPHSFPSLKCISIFFALSIYWHDAVSVDEHALERVVRPKAKFEEGNSFHSAMKNSTESNLSAAIAMLSSMQGPQGGFGKPSPSLQATNQALFLARLYGVMGRIDVKKAVEYVRAAAMEAQVGF